MAAAVSPEVIQRTQESLGRFVRKPPLTEKLLAKPPFRFLHDIFSAAMRDTGIMEGTWTVVFSKKYIKNASKPYTILSAEQT